MLWPFDIAREPWMAPASGNIFRSLVSRCLQWQAETKHTHEWWRSSRDL